MPTIYIDADACPVTAEVLVCARRNKVPVVVVGNSTQNLTRHMRHNDPRRPANQEDDGNPTSDTTSRFWVDTLVVGIGPDAADFAIVEVLEPNDIVVTQDIGLAAMVLGRQAKAIGVRGRVYTPFTIDMDMEIRHQEKKIRRSGGRTGGPAPFTDDDRERFSCALERLIEEASRDSSRDGEIPL